MLFRFLSAIIALDNHLDMEGVISLHSTRAIIRIAPPDDHSDSFPLLLRPLLFSPAAAWLVRALQEAGVERFLLLTPHAWLAEAAACFPEGTRVCCLEDPALDAAVAAFAAEDTDEVISITEPVWLSVAGAALLTQLPTLPQEDAPIGVQRIPASAIHGSADLYGGEVFAPLMDESPFAIPLSDPSSFDSAQYLGRLERAELLSQQGVRVFDPQSIYLDPTVTVAPGTVLLPNVILRGHTHIGPNCEIGPDTMIRDCTLGEGCVVNSSQLNESVFGNRVNIGPFAYVRPGSQVADGCKVGDFVEVKNAVIGEGTKLPHLIYVGDSDVGKRCNFGCGSITCNYDGNVKSRTTVGDDVFVGCNSNLVAPVTLENGAYTAAGSTITDTVPADTLAIARTRQVHVEGWVQRHRAKKKP